VADLGRETGESSRQLVARGSGGGDPQVQAQGAHPGEQVDRGQGRSSHTALTWTLREGKPSKPVL
jgi:hypothetical protein